MNLRNVVAGAISVINPPTSVTIHPSTGYTTSADGTQVPTYGTSITTTGDVQSLSGKDIERLNKLNIQGISRKIWLNGNYEGLIRKSGKGGDLIQFNNDTYTVSAVLERWPDWCSLAITLQTQ